MDHVKQELEKINSLILSINNVRQRNKLFEVRDLLNWVLNPASPGPTAKFQQ